MYSPSQPGATPDPRIITPGDLKRERLKFTDFKFRRTPGGKCSAEVELNGSRDRVRGPRGQSSEQGYSRLPRRPLARSAFYDTRWSSRW